MFNRWRNCELGCAIFANIGTITAIVDYEQNYSPYRTYNNCHENSQIMAYKAITLIVTFMAILFLVMKHHHKGIWIIYLYETEKKLNKISGMYYMSKYIKKQPKKYINWMRVLEVILLLIFPYPYIDLYVYVPFRWDYQILYICYTVNELLFVFIFIRLLFLFKALANYTIYENHIARRFCAFYGTRSNVLFSFRCILAQYSLPIIVTFLAIPSILILGLMLRVFERPLESLSGQDYQDPLNPIWLVFITMSTIGFGDYYPISYHGRAIAVISYIIGAFILTMIIVSLERQTDLSPNQFKVFTNIHKTKAAATSVCSAFEYFYFRKMRGKSDFLTLKKKQELYRNVQWFKKTKEELIELNTQKENEVIELNQTMQKIDSKIKRLSWILESMTENIYSQSLIINSDASMSINF
ncbi:unnamed protein product [Blepharisma stoltei]|uniref:Potassium channel domain-containing protein n=1 Tax=Blepharisma stoltei TaxID=1481888 RepID=A0AAU9JYR1_9CILI|nr:unnamed protein product [Blepharisma stoltei]